MISTVDKVRILVRLDSKGKEKAQFHLNHSFIKKWELKPNCKIHFAFDRLREIVFMIIGKNVVCPPPYFLRFQETNSRPGIIYNRDLCFQICQNLNLNWVDEGCPKIDHLLDHKILTVNGQIPRIFRLRKMMKIDREPVAFQLK